MPPVGPVIVMLIVFAATAVAVGAALAHALIHRFWLVCGAVTTLVLLGCVALHAVEGYRDALSIASLYGIGGGTALAISILVGLPFVLVRRTVSRWHSR